MPTERRVLTNKELLQYLKRDYIFWLLLGMLIAGFYYNSKLPQYTTKTINNVSYVNASYKGFNIDYTLYLTTAFCKISIPANNFVWYNIADGSIPQEFKAIINETTPAKKWCD